MIAWNNFLVLSFKIILTQALPIIFRPDKKGEVYVNKKQRTFEILSAGDF